LLIIGFVKIKEKNMAHKLFLIAVMSIAALFAVMSKQQDILLVLPVLAVFWFLLKRFGLGKWIAIIWSALFIAVTGFLFASNGAAGNVSAFNVTSMDLLPASENPEEQLEQLGFSEEDIKIIIAEIGNSAFSVSYDWSVYADGFTRLNELRIIAREPEIFFKMLASRARNLFLDAPYGNYLESSGAAEGEKTNENRLWYNLKKVLYVRNVYFYFGVLLVAFLFALFGCRIKALSQIPEDLFRIYLMFPIANILRFITVLLGDGSFDDAKHFFSVNVEFDVMYICNLILISVVLGCFLSKLFNSEGKEIK